jgi:hypothetical protein
VLIISVVVTSCWGFPVIEFGEKEQDAPAGNPLQLKATWPLNPNSDPMVTVLVADWPAVKYSDVGDRVTLKLGGRVYVAEATGLCVYPGTTAIA